MGWDGSYSQRPEDRADKSMALALINRMHVIQGGNFALDALFSSMIHGVLLVLWFKTPCFLKFIHTYAWVSAFWTSRISRCTSQFRLFLVYEVRSTNQMRVESVERRTIHSSLNRGNQGARLFSRSIKCQNGFNTTTINASSVATGP